MQQSVAVWRWAWMEASHACHYIHGEGHARTVLIQFPGRTIGAVKDVAFDDPALFVTVHQLPRLERATHDGSGRGRLSGHSGVPTLGVGVAGADPYHLVAPTLVN